MAKYLTTKQQEVLKFIWDFLQEKHYQPSFKDISDKFRYKSYASVSDHLDAMKAKGFLEVGKQQSRAVRFTEKGLISVRGIVIELDCSGGTDISVLHSGKCPSCSLDMKAEQSFYCGFCNRRHFI